MHIHITYQELIKDLREKQAFTRLLVFRVIELFMENEKLRKGNEELKNELRSRRHQADVWRRKFQELSTEKK